MPGLFDDVLGPQQTRASTGLFDDVLGGDDVVTLDPVTVVAPRTMNPLEGARARVYDLLGSGIRGVANVAEQLGDRIAPSIPFSGVTEEEAAAEQQLAPLFGASDFLRNAAKEVGYQPSVPLGDVKTALTTPNAGLGEFVGNLGTAGQFALEQAITSTPDMAAAVGALPAYMLTRTQEIGERRVANDNRTGEPSLGDLGAALPAAALESTLERFASKALVPGSSAAATPAARVLESLGLQVGTEAGEEAIANLGESLGTERGVDLQELGDVSLAGGLGGLAVGGGGSVVNEIVHALGNRGAPAPAAAPQAPLGAPPVVAPPAPLGGAPEDTGDLDAMLLASLPPEAIEAAANATPEEGAQALAALGDVPGMAPDPDAPFRRPDAAPVPAAPIETAAPAPVITPPAAPVEDAAPALELTPPAEPTKAPPAAKVEGRREWRPSERKDSKGRPIVEPVIDYSRDGLLEWLGTVGGVDFEAVRSQGGADPALLKDPAVMRPFGRVGFSALRKSGGLDLETLREKMQEAGWLQADDPNAPPQTGVNDALDLVMEAINGRPVRHPTAGNDARLEGQREQMRQEEEARDAELAVELGFPDAPAMYDAIETAQDRQDGDGFNEEDYRDALSLAELAERANDAGFGLSDAEIESIITQAGDDPAAQAAALWRAIDERQGSDGTETAADGRSTEARQAPFRSEEAPGRVAEEQTGLFGKPTASEEVDAARRAKDDKRDGKNTQGRTDIAAGDGELFAGERPEQLRTEEGAPQYVKRGATDYLADASGEPRDFLTLGAATAEAERVGGQVLVDDAMEGQRPTWSVVRPPVGRVEASRDMFVPTRGDREADNANQDRNGRGDSDSRPAGTGGVDAGDVRSRPDATPELTRRATNAVDDLVRRHRGSVLADTLAREFRANDTARLIGQHIKSEQDLAALAEVYRNPLFETLHYVFVDRQGLVLGEVAISDRMPSSAAAFPARVSAKGMGGIAQWVKDVAPAGAVGFWMTHNHPSGNPTPSGADLTLTGALSRTMAAAGGPRVLGHVVLNHKTYGRITPNGEARDNAELPKTGPDPLRAPRGHFVDNMVVQGPSTAATVGKEIFALTDSNSVAVIVTNAQGRVVLATAFPADVLAGNRGPAILSQLGERSGGASLFLVASREVIGTTEGATVKGLQILSKRGLVRDVIVVEQDGSTNALAQHGILAAKGLGEQSPSRVARMDRGTRVFEEDDYRDKDLIGDKVKTPAEQRVDAARTAAAEKRGMAAATLPVSLGAAGWNYDSGKWEGRAGQRANVRAHLQDKMLAWRDVQGQIESQLQKVIPDAQNVYRLENLMHGRVSDAIEKIERQHVKPLLEAMRAAKVSPDTLEEYLYARHAEERNAQIADINPSMPDGGSGMTNAEAREILSRADTATLDPLARRVDAIAKATRQRLLDHGLITKDAFEAMDAQYEHYVPLRGKAIAESEDFGGNGGGMAGRGLDTRGKPIKQALGRGAGNRAEHILGEIIGDAERSVILAEKARVGRAVMRIVLANPNPALWQVEPVNTERALDASGEVYEKVVNDWSDPSVVAVRHKGQLFKVQINNAPLAQALNNIGIDQLGAITRVAGAVNRYFSAILTKYNPAFVPVNASRDVLFGLTGLAAEHGELAALDAALHYPQAAAAAFQHARGKKLDGEWGTYAEEFAEHGGKTGYVNLPSTEDIARKIGSGSLTSYTPDGLRKATRAIADAVGVLNDSVENALRLSAYVTLRKRGSSPDAAAAYAKDLTVNFNRKGFDGSKLNAWFLFYNASIQGGHRVSKLLRKPKTWAYLGSLAAMQVVAVLAAMGMKDDNDEPLWNKVPDHVKRRNIVIVLPDGGLITIPMPYGFNLFPYMAGRITEAVANGQRGDERPSNSVANLTADAISAATQSFSPVPLDTGAVGLVPNLLRIPLNVWANRNDFGNKIRDEQPYGKSDVPRSSMGKADTLEVFKLASKGLNRLGGGDDLTPPPLSMFDLAPEDLEYLLKELTGGPGNLITEIATSGQKATGGDYAQDLEPRDIPIAKRFFSNIDEQAAQQAMFYDRRETIDRSLKRVRLAYKAEGAEAAEALMASTPELKGAAFKRRKGKGRKGEAPGSIILVDGNPQIIAVEGDPDMPPPSVFAAYKRAEKVVSARSESVEQMFKGAPASIVPTERTRQRDASLRTENSIRQAAQSEFNAAWVRDVVGSMEDGEAPKGVKRYDSGEPKAEYFGTNAKSKITPAPDVLKGAKNAPKMVMVGDWSQLPSEDVRKAFDNGADGVFDPSTKRVYVAMGMDPAYTKFVAYHEIAGHYGLQGAMGKDYEAVMNRAMQNPTIEKLARKLHGDGYQSESNRLALTEEALAEVAAAVRSGDFDMLERERGVKIPAAVRPGMRGMIGRVVQLTKRKLADLTGEEPDAYDDAQVYSLIEDAWRYVERGPRE